MVEPKVWTTAPDTDVCIEYGKRQAPDFSQFDAKPACEEWVRERRCRPGMSCNNGCNDVGCDGTGMSMRSTLLGCEVALAVDPIEFPAKSAKLPAALSWDKAVGGLERLFRLPSRKLKIIGFALPSEAASPVAVKHLARQRAEAVAKVLVSHGLARARLVIQVGEPSTFGVEGYRVGRVSLQLDPNQLEPQEYEPSFPGYENLCWVKYRTSPVESLSR